MKTTDNHFIAYIICNIKNYIHLGFGSTNIDKLQKYGIKYERQIKNIRIELDPFRSRGAQPVAPKLVTEIPSACGGCSHVFLISQRRRVEYSAGGRGK